MAGSKLKFAQVVLAFNSPDHFIEEKTSLATCSGRDGEEYSGVPSTMVKHARLKPKDQENLEKPVELVVIDSLTNGKSLKGSEPNLEFEEDSLDDEDEHTTMSPLHSNFFTSILDGNEDDDIESQHAVGEKEDNIEPVKHPIVTSWVSAIDNPQEPSEVRAI